MKRNRLSGLMVAAMMVGMLFVSCEKTVTLKASVDDFSGNSKVYLDGFLPCWNEGDPVWVNGTSYGVGHINGNSASIEVRRSNLYEAVFPVGIVKEITETSVFLTIPQEQYYCKDGKGNQKIEAMMYAYANNTDLEFRNLEALLAVDVTNKTSHGAMRIDSIVVKASNAALCGKATLYGRKTNDCVCKITDLYEEGKNDVVTLCGTGRSSMGEKLNTNNSKTFYISVPEIDISTLNRLSFTVYATVGGAHYSYTRTQPTPGVGCIMRNELAIVSFCLEPGIETFEGVYGTTEVVNPGSTIYL